LNKTVTQNNAAISSSYDYIIVGAGAACLHLLVQWETEPFFSDKKILVLDPEMKRNNDRTWCFWSSPEDSCYRNYAPELEATWKRIKMGSREEILPSLGYHCLTGKKAYEKMNVLIEKNPNIERLYLYVEDWLESAEGVQVSAQGKVFHCNHLFTTALTHKQIELLRKKDMLKQSFYGWWIEAELPEARRETAILMDFDIPQENQCQFIYFLPFPQGRALIEVTRFGSVPLDPAQAESFIKQWLITHNITHWKLEEVEMGSIPMSVDLGLLTQSSNRVTSIGTSGGVIKPSTGYGFHRMQRHAEEITQKILASQSPSIRTQQPNRFKFYDRILLNLLLKKPWEGKRIFHSLFRSIPNETTLNFLEEKTHFKEEISILSSLPFGLFAKSFVQVYLLRYPFLRPPSIFSMVILMLTSSLLLGYSVAPEFFENLGLGLLIAGLIFPGIPHGAVDHLLGSKALNHWKKWLGFVMGYLLIMAGVIVLWMAAPVLGLIGFLLYSAWHFGQTDMQQVGILSGRLNLIQGYGVLAFLLGTHADETQFILQLMLSQPHFTIPDAISMTMSLTGLLALGIPAFYISGKKASEWILLVLSMILASQLPLLLAFGIYFIGIHSVRSWLHLQKGLSFSFGRLVLHSMPFSLGAFFVGGLLYWVLRILNLPFDQWIPYLFLFLAAISAPHIFYMHTFYASKKI
jgi:lycopene beta-cyclase